MLGRKVIADYEQNSSNFGRCVEQNSNFKYLPMSCITHNFLVSPNDGIFFGSFLLSSGLGVGSGAPGFGFGRPRQARDLTFQVISSLSEISGSRYALGIISSLTIKYYFYIKLPLCMYSKITIIAISILYHHYYYHKMLKIRKKTLINLIFIVAEHQSCYDKINHWNCLFICINIF